MTRTDVSRASTATDRSVDVARDVQRRRRAEDLPPVFAPRAHARERARARRDGDDDARDDDDASSVRGRRDGDAGRVGATGGAGAGDDVAGPGSAPAHRARVVDGDDDGRERERDG